MKLETKFGSTENAGPENARHEIAVKNESFNLAEAEAEYNTNNGLRNFQHTSYATVTTTELLTTFCVQTAYV